MNDNIIQPTGDDWSKWGTYVINQLKENQESVKDVSSKINAIHTDLVDRLSDSISLTEKDVASSIRNLEEKVAKMIGEIDFKINTSLQNIQNKNDRMVDELKLEVKSLKTFEMREMNSTINKLTERVSGIELSLTKDINSIDKDVNGQKNFTLGKSAIWGAIITISLTLLMSAINLFVKFAK
jgi:gas vesicle protein